MTTREPLPLYDRRNYRRAPATMPGHGRGRPSQHKGRTFQAELFEPSEVQALIDECPVDSLFGLRLRAFIATLYRTGMYPQELVNARLADLVMTRGQESIRASGTFLRDRRLALDDFCLSYLRLWLAARQELGGEHVFCVVDGPTVGRDWAATATRKELRRLGKKVLDRRVNPGSLRATLAAELIVEQWPLAYLQTQMGLSSARSLEKLLSDLGIHSAPEGDVAELARSRPPVDDTH